MVSIWTAGYLATHVMIWLGCGWLWDDSAVIECGYAYDRMRKERQPVLLMEKLVLRSYKKETERQWKVRVEKCICADEGFWDWGRGWQFGGS